MGLCEDLFFIIFDILKNGIEECDNGMFYNCKCCFVFWLSIFYLEMRVGNFWRLKFYING